MGSELYAYFPVRAGDRSHQAGMAELARELDQEDVRSESDESQVVARLDPASQVREGVQAQLWLDVRRIHLFDPESGENLTLPPAAGTGAGAAAGSGTFGGSAAGGPGMSGGTGTGPGMSGGAAGGPGITGDGAPDGEGQRGTDLPPRGGGAHRAT
jgi:multiple sugar transport system ATP-binding protein